MDIKETIEKAVAKITETLKKDGSMLELFKKNPIKVVEKLIGKDLPDEAVTKIINLVKTNLKIGKAQDAANVVKYAIGGAIDGLTDMFKK